MSRFPASQLCFIIPLLGLCTALSLPDSPVTSTEERPVNEDSYLFHDSHFHLTYYVQEGTEIRRFLEIMGDKVGRSMLCGIPLQQQWMYANTGDFAPTYYTQSDAPLYYYSFTKSSSLRKSPERWQHWRTRRWTVFSITASSTPRRLIRSPTSRFCIPGQPWSERNLWNDLSRSYGFQFEIAPCSPFAEPTG